MNRILIAEGKPLSALFLARGLQSAGYATLVAADGDQALQLAGSLLFDLLLLDLALPGRPSLDVLGELRRQRSRLPVIALSSWNSPLQIVAALEGGADDCMAKPYQFTELLARVRARLRPRPARATAG
jgi:two-component system, OmpR family, copper resistance phosphate regulon response regulator CusR